MCNRYWNNRYYCKNSDVNYYLNIISYYHIHYIRVYLKLTAMNFLFEELQWIQGDLLISY